MAITYRTYWSENVGELYCPVIECDRCGDIITDPGMAVICFPDAAGSLLTRENTRGRFEFRHKRTCFLRDERYPWDSLTNWLAQLNNNVTSDPTNDPAIHRTIKEKNAR
jgi:hypothetical protein